jgi:hypothetical protein
MLDLWPLLTVAEHKLVLDTVKAMAASRRST